MTQFATWSAHSIYIMVQWLNAAADACTFFLPWTMSSVLKARTFMWPSPNWFSNFSPRKFMRFENPISWILQMPPTTCKHWQRILPPDNYISPPAAHANIRINNWQFQLRNATVDNRVCQSQYWMNSWYSKMPPSFCHPTSTRPFTLLCTLRDAKN